MCLPKKCCCQRTLKQGFEGIILYDGAWVIFYTCIAIGITIAMILFSTQSSDNQFRIIIMWSLLSLLIAKFLPGTLAYRKKYKSAIVGIQFICRLVCDCILFVFTLLLLIFFFSVIYVIGNVAYFSIQVYLLIINYAFYKNQLNRRNTDRIPKIPQDCPNIVQPKAKPQVKYVPTPVSYYRKESTEVMISMYDIELKIRDQSEVINET